MELSGRIVPWTKLCRDAPGGTRPSGRGVAYRAASAAIGRFEKRLKVDRELQRKLKAVRAMLKI
jgi:hypothetical protein